MNTRPTISLYDQNPSAWQRLADMGFSDTAEMAKHFTRCADMDRELGFQNASARWHRGAGQPSKATNSFAAGWLRLQAQKVDNAPARDEPVATLLLVACTPATADKARRVLAVLGCEVTEV